MIPPRPPRFTSDAAPLGVEIDLVTFSDTRPAIDTTALHVHTNAASKEGTIESAKRHIYAAPGSNTLPHYQIDRTHNGITRACKFLDTSLRGIGSTTVGRTTRDSAGRLIWPTLTDTQRATIDAHDNVRDHTIVIETADTGYLDDPTISAFDPGQIEALAQIEAFEAIVHGFPLAMQVNYWDPGIGSHTDPWGFPYTTIHRGKFCPGLKKKTQVRTVVLARAIEIARAWTYTPNPNPTPTTEDDMLFLVRAATNPNLYLVANGIESRRLRAANLDELVADLVAPSWGLTYHDPTKPGSPEITEVAEIPFVSDDELVRLGYEIDESTPA